jgi:hypothetical protein
MFLRQLLMADMVCTTIIAKRARKFPIIRENHHGKILPQNIYRLSLPHRAACYLIARSNSDGNGCEDS